jgi:hypothetical protein
LLQEDDNAPTILIVAIKELEDRAGLLNRRRDMVMGRNYI